MRVLFLIVGLLLALVARAAEARMHAPYRGHRIVPAAAPLDTFATPAAAYSMRRLKSTYSGPAIRLRRDSDNAEADIGFLGFTGFTGAPIDVAAANAHCTSACTVAAWYDQSGNARHVTQATPANQPAYVADCGGGKPCAQITTAAQNLTSVSLTPVLPPSFSVVANRPTGGTGTCYFPWNNNMMLSPGAGAWGVNGGGGGQVAGFVTDGAWHAASGVVNGAASVFNADNVELTGTTTGSTAGATISLFGSAATTCNIAEIAVWYGYALTQPERAVLVNNQRNFWGF